MDDLINRKGIVDKVCEGISCNECSFNEIDGESGCLLAYRIDQLPSAQKTGRWQKYEGRFDYNWECSECECSSYEKTDYCAHCGARMECEEE